MIGTGQGRTNLTRPWPVRERESCPGRPRPEPESDRRAASVRVRQAMPPQPRVDAPTNG
jgi:hypothetical protein